MIATDESMRVSSSIAIAYESVSVPPPPYSSGIVIPIRPSSASSATSSYGNRFSRSSSSATGATFASANSRTVSRSSSCSGSRSKFTTGGDGTEEAAAACRNPLPWVKGSVRPAD